MSGDRCFSPSDRSCVTGWVAVEFGWLFFFLLFFWQSMKFAPGPVPCCSFFQPPSLFSCVPPSPDPRPCWLPKLPFYLLGTAPAGSEAPRREPGAGWDELGGVQRQEKGRKGEEKGTGGNPTIFKARRSPPRGANPLRLRVGDGLGIPGTAPPSLGRTPPAAS